ncbi:MAG: phosphate ABC transporter permease PstA [bacterium]|nr:phosphate ABC transporter permease PstA [bacterium]
MLEGQVTIASIHERPRAGLLDFLTALGGWTASLTVAGAIGWILFDVFAQGLSNLDWRFLIEPVQRSGRAGGIGPLIVSTGLILLVCLAASVPIGLLSAILLAEFSAQGNRFVAWVRRALDVLAGVPSIVFGLFGNALFCIYLGMGFSILSGGLTLACMVLPLFIRSAEEGFRSVPGEYRLAGFALGMSRARLLFRIQLPEAAPGLAVGLILSVGRALAETAALIFTSGYVTRMPSSLADSGRSLSVHIYDLAMNVPGGGPNAYKTALVLVVLLVFINFVTTWIAKHGLHKRILSL